MQFVGRPGLDSIRAILSPSSSITSHAPAFFSVIFRQSCFSAGRVNTSCFFLAANYRCLSVRTRNARGGVPRKQNCPRDERRERKSKKEDTKQKLLEPICRCLAPAAPLVYHRNGSRKHPKFKSSAVLVTLTYFRETWADSSRDAFFPLSFPQGRE